MTRKATPKKVAAKKATAKRGPPSDASIQRAARAASLDRLDAVIDRAERELIRLSQGPISSQMSHENGPRVVGSTGCEPVWDFNPIKRDYREGPERPTIGSEPIRPPRLDDVLGMQAASINELEETVKQLRDRLEWILAPPGPKSETAMANPCDTQATNYITSNRHRIDAVNGDLADIINRLRL